MNLVERVQDKVYDNIITAATKYGYSLSNMLYSYKIRVNNLTKTKQYIGRESHIYVKAWQGVKREYDL
jgi:hypothetical protein